MALRQSGNVRRNPDEVNRRLWAEITSAQAAELLEMGHSGGCSPIAGTCPNLEGKDFPMR